MQIKTGSLGYEYSNFQKFMNVFNSIIKFIGNVFLVLLIAILLVMLVYNVYSKKTGNTKPPLVSAYVIISSSMVPTINVLDAVVAYRPNVENLKKGDIITFSSSDVRYTGLTVTHRILKVENENGTKQFKTKGDSNTTPDDARVISSNIFGKVVFVIPWLGYIQKLLTQPFGWILLVVFPCLGIVVFDIIKLQKSLKKSKVTKNIKFKDVEIKK